jgi:hypothetical protein
VNVNVQTPKVRAFIGPQEQTVGFLESSSDSSEQISIFFKDHVPQ